MAFLHHLRAGLRHWLHVVDEHSIHSPFFFDFYNRVLHGRTDPATYQPYEKLRDSLEVNNAEIEVLDLGAGAATYTREKRKLSDIARTSVSPRELAELYVRIAGEIKARRIVELGSSLGITTLYLAHPEEAMVYTFEGSPSLTNIALTNYEYFEKKNIRLFEGNIDTTLPDFLQDPAKVNFALIDANHRYLPTTKYFSWLVRRLDEKSIMVIDDIHWSPDMEKAWYELIRSPLVYGSVDLFRCGILFFDPALNRQHFVWNF